MAGLVPAISVRSVMGEPRQYWVYMMASRPGGALYIGVTNDLTRRVWQHKNGQGSAHCRKYKIDQLVWCEEFADVREAIQRETSMKRWPRVYKTRLILEFNPTWRDLSIDLA
jgi:putative endonuclease